MVFPSSDFTMSPGRWALLATMFSTAGTKAVTGIGRLQLRDGPHGAEHCRSARHVVLHFLHAVGGLDGDAAGIEGDAFADQSQMVGGFRRGCGL